MTWGSRLRRRRGLLLGSGAALLLTGAFHVTAESVWRRDLRHAESVAVAEAGREAVAARQVLLRSLDAIDALSQVVQERALLLAQDNAAGAAAMEALARLVVARHAFGILQVAFIGLDGRVAWSSVDGWQPLDLSDRTHVRVHLPRPGDAAAPDRLHVSEPLVGRISNSRTLQFSRRVRDAAGRPAGVSVISVDPLDLSRLLRQVLPEAQGVAALMRDDGTFLARSRDPAETIGRVLPPDNRMLALMRDGQEADARIHGTIGGNDIFVAIRRLPDTPLFVAASIDARHALADAYRLRTVLRAADGVFAILILGTVWLLHLRRERRAGEAALAATSALQAEMARVLEGLPGAAYRAEIDAAGRFRFLYASSAITGLTGYDAATLRSLAFWVSRVDLAEPPDALVGLHMRAMREGRQTVDLRFRRRDGEQRWLQVTVQPAAPAEGRTELVGYVSDVTKKRAALAAVVNNAKLATLGEMATGLAHELNQPVTVMALAAENAALALRRRGPAALPDALQRLDRVGTLAQRAKAIIDHLRTFGRVDPGPLEPVALAEVVAGARLLTGAALREAGITLVIDLPDDLPRVEGRAILLEQVLINLLLNARDALAPDALVSTARDALAPDSCPVLGPDARDTLAPDARDTRASNTRDGLAPHARPVLGLDARPALAPDAHPALGPDARPALVSDARPALEQGARPALVPNARDALAPDARPAQGQDTWDAPANGSPDRRITISAWTEAAGVVIRVADTGPGIPEAVLPRIFEPFFTTKSTGQGTGLGLSLCHGIMQSLGGEIAARNCTTGAEFRLLLRQAALPAEPLPAVA